MQDLFQDAVNDIDNNDSQVTIPEQALETLVGDGKKFKDTEALAKSVYHKDNYIAKLATEKKAQEDEVARLREELKTRKTIEDLMSAVNSGREHNPQGDLDNQNRSAGLSEEQIAQMLDQKLTERQKQALANQNLSIVQSEMTKVYGDGAASKIRAKAQELGVTTEFLQSVAVSSPKAFLELVKPTTTVAPDGIPNSSIRTPSGNNGVRNKSWYDAQMRADRKLRTDPNFQTRMHRDAIAQGEKFFD